jgi:uncharacterized RDD family membrane protein YckC
MIRYASFGRRTWAFVLTLIIDLVVLGTLKAVVGDGDVLGPFAAWYLIHHVGLVTEGGTLGSRIAGLRVVALDGTRVDVVHAFLREIVFLGLSVPPLGLGVLWMLDEPQRRTWHDLLAGTVVVRELSASVEDAPAWADAPPWRRRDEPPVPADSRPIPD